MTAFYRIGAGASTDGLTADTAGAKAAELARMARLGLTVPPAFVLPTALCAPANRGEGEAEIAAALREGMAWLEGVTGKRFGDDRNPLLVSVRSGAARSMPGMMSTILDVGLNAQSVRGLILQSGNPRLAWDCYRRFLQMFCEVLDEAAPQPFESSLADLIRSEEVAGESELDSEALERLAVAFRTQARRPVPDDPCEQLLAATLAVYRSWESPRAREYRRLNHLETLAGTAVTVQAMVFGNAAGPSGAGVAFSRDPATGEKSAYVDFLSDAQGEDVVAGRRRTGDADSLERRLPDVARQLRDGLARLERDARDMQDVEFTVENGTLFFLQTRTAKRTPRAALRILVDMVAEGLIDRRTALARAEAIDPDAAAETCFTDAAAAIATATVASPGVASGRIAFSSDAATTLSADGSPVILVRQDTATEDVAGFAAAAGILTARGGRTAHAAVVARQLGKVCLVGCAALEIDVTASRGRIAGRDIAQGDWLSLDGETGAISLGRRPVRRARPEAELALIAQWRAEENAAPPQSRKSGLDVRTSDQK